MIHASIALERPLGRGEWQHGRRFQRELRRLIGRGERGLCKQLELYTMRGARRFQMLLDRGFSATAAASQLTSLNKRR